MFVADSQNTPPSKSERTGQHNAPSLWDTGFVEATREKQPRWYGVRTGRITGIFTDLADVVQCTKGQANNCYKGFRSEEEAVRFLSLLECAACGRQWCKSPMKDVLTLTPAVTQMASQYSPSPNIPLAPTAPPTSPSPSTSLSLSSMSGTPPECTTASAASLPQAILVKMIPGSEKLPYFGVTVESYLASHWRHVGSMKIKRAVGSGGPMSKVVNAILDLKLDGMDILKAEWLYTEIYKHWALYSNASTS
ncbi:hypothetical protein FRC03_009305 [Tulasnella sp. 419]|nr:hypothetical protein FRC02_003727 [Tulasnella sp. 418]KAG8958251.1 hypothetical protein FRC03_009305 [Tulasnella sp. 419]